MPTQTSQLEAALAAFDELVMAGTPPDSGAFCARFPHLHDLPRYLEILRSLREGGPFLGVEQLPPNRRLGEFEIVRPLGSGGMGQVYLAWQREPHRLCAVKTVRLLGENSVERFRREAAITSKLDHPNIAAVYGAGDADGLAYMALQLIYGSSLRAMLDHADVATSEATWVADVLSAARERSHAQRSTGSVPMPASIATDIAKQTATGLAHAHDRGIVHRDIKPNNIMIAVSGQVKIIDFGIAFTWLDDSDFLTATGGFVGTYDYAAPEQLQGDRAGVGPWSDTYALGATLFEMLTQRPPYVCAGYTERLRLAEAPIATGPRQIAPNTPRRLDMVVRKALSLKPADRFQDGAELAEALTDAAEFERKGRTVALPVGGRLRPLSAISSFFNAQNALWFVLCAVLFSWGLHQHTARLEAQHEQTRLEHLRDQAVVDEVLDARQPEFLRCIIATRKPGKYLPPVLLPRFEGLATVLNEHVQAVKVSSFSRNLTTDAKNCMATLAKGLVFPGVGMGGSHDVQLVLTFPSDSVMPLTTSEGAGTTKR